MISNQTGPFSFPLFHNQITDFFRIEPDIGSRPDNSEPYAGPYHQILYCHSNCGAEILVGSTRFLLQRGDMILVPSGMSSSWPVRSRAGESYFGFRLCLEVTHMEILEPFLASLPSDMTICHHIRTANTIWEPIGDLFRLLYQEMRERSPGWETAAMSCCLLLLTQIRRALVSLSQSFTKEEGPILVEQILRYVHTHFRDRITLDDVAQKFWVSPSTVTHLFSKNTGTSFYKYVTHIRLAEAKNLISEGMSMEKVAQNVGFNDYSAFYRAFRKEFNLSPKQYLQTFVK